MSSFGSDIYSCAGGKLLEVEYGFLKLNCNVINETRPRGVISEYFIKENIQTYIKWENLVFIMISLPVYSTINSWYLYVPK